MSRVRRPPRRAGAAALGRPASTVTVADVGRPGRASERVGPRTRPGAGRRAPSRLRPSPGGSADALRRTLPDDRAPEHRPIGRSGGPGSRARPGERRCSSLPQPPARPLPWTPSGTRTSTRVPPSGVESSSMRPPAASTRPAARRGRRARPRAAPRPPGRKAAPVVFHDQHELAVPLGEADVDEARARVPHDVLEQLARGREDELVAAGRRRGRAGRGGAGCALGRPPPGDRAQGRFEPRLPRGRTGGGRRRPRELSRRGDSAASARASAGCESSRRPPRARGGRRRFWMAWSCRASASALRSRCSASRASSGGASGSAASRHASSVRRSSRRQSSTHADADPGQVARLRDDEPCLTAGCCVPGWTIAWIT